MFDPDHIFLAARTLAELPFTSGIYQRGLSGVIRDPRNGNIRWAELPNSSDCLPSYDPGACGSTGGLAIYFYRWWPRWVETPWGEWYPWSPNPSEHWHGSREIFLRLCGALDIDEERSRKCDGPSPVLALRSVNGIVLPPYRCGGNMYKKQEWIELFRKHVPLESISEQMHYYYAPR